MTEDRVFSLAGLIDEWVASRESKEFPHWRASQVGQCLRKHFLLRQGVEPTNPASARSGRVFAAGDAFHSFIQDIVEDRGFALYREHELFDEELDLGGRLDLVVQTDEGKKILYDIKSQHSQSFWHMERESKELGKPTVYPHHAMQLAAYALLLRRSGTPVDEARMFYVSKDDLLTREVTVNTVEPEGKVLAEIEKLNHHLEAGTLPPCTCGETSWGIGYCPYADPESEEYVEKTSKSGKTYKKKELTSCCSEELWHNSPS